MAVDSDPYTGVVFQVGGMLAHNGSIAGVRHMFVKAIMEPGAVRAAGFCPQRICHYTGEQGGPGEHFGVVQNEYGHVQYP